MNFQIFLYLYSDSDRTDCFSPNFPLFNVCSSFSFNGMKITTLLGLKTSKIK